ncbi:MULTISPECIES: LysE family translocator [unclassified Inquilinus]|uniref:LysE family translocator n=1 Tax=unclassified Inquilinus TaxID=2645927 RepID=UPI003F9029B7
MVTGSILAFLGVSLLVIVTPGPDTAVTVRNALLGGRAGGIFTALGVSLGQAVWAFATSLGIVALLVASEPLFLAVKYAGAAYLVWLGLHALRAAWRPGMADAATTAQARRLGRGTAFRQGLVSDLGNPKMAVFFASLLPQFVPDGQPAFAVFLALGLVFSLMTFAWLAAYAVAVAKAGDVLRRPRIRRAIEGVTGVLLIALGLRIAAEQR